MGMGNTMEMSIYEWMVVFSSGEFLKAGGS